MATSQAADAGTKRMSMKRSNFSPWTARGLGGSSRTPAQSSPSQQSAAKKGGGTANPGPANIVSDVLPSTETSTPPPSAKPSLASNSRIVLAQERWERRESETAAVRSRAGSTGSDNSTSTETSTSSGAWSVPAILPAAPTQTSSSVSNQALPELKPNSAAPRAMIRKRSGEAAASDAKRSKVAERTSSPATHSRKGSGAGLQLAALEEAKAAVNKQLSSMQDGDVWKKHRTPTEVLAEIRKTHGRSSPADATASPASEGVSSPQPQTQALVYTPDGRRYDTFIDSNGHETLLRGALFPTGYKSKLDRPLMPYPCPVRGCSTSLPKLESLRSHFGAHSGTTYHDNGDGTVSKVGTYKNAYATSPAIVVSAFAGRPTGLQNTDATPASKKPETPVPLPQIGQRTSTDIKKYLNGLLSPAQPIPDRPDVKHMLQLKKKRDLPDSWVSRHKGQKLDVSIYAIALAYICGDEITGPSSCSRTGPGSASRARLSGICVAPPSFPVGVQEAFSKTPTCVGCRYSSALHHQSNKCDWGDKRGEVGSSRETTSVSVEERPPVPPVQRTTSEARQKTQQIQAADAEDEAQPVGGVGGVLQDAMSAAGRAAAQLEMEEWEFAPGRKIDASTSETIAISSAYQTSKLPIAVSEDVGINDIVVERGRSHQWLAEKDKLRICYVAAGKVLVKMGGETFRQGPNSSLVIRPGKTCTVENRFYVDAVVHCTTIKDYEVADG